MFKNNTIRTMLIILVVIALAGGVAIYFLLHQSGSASKAPTIDEILKNSVDITDLTTNLAGGNYIKISFKIETNSKAATSELTKREFQVKNIMIEVLSDTKESNLDGSAGIVQLENTLKNRINTVMQDGKVVQVYVTDSLLQ